jgi:hypothetical protein
MSFAPAVTRIFTPDAKPDATFGLSLGLAVDSQAYMNKRRTFGVWFRSTARLFDTTTLLSATLVEEDPNDDDQLSPTIRWQDVFVPGATVGIGFGSRRLPLAADLGVVAGRYTEGDESRLRPALYFGLSLNIPLFDLR